MIPEKLTDNKQQKKKAHYDKQRNQFLLTLNNPKDYGYSHEQIRNIIKNKFKHVLFYCMADDISTTGTYHTHLYILMSAKKRWSSVQRAFVHAYIEPEIKGTPAQIVSYIKKETVSDDKKKTLVKGTYEEFGSLPTVMPSDTKHDILIQIEELIQQNLTPEEIMSQSILYRQFETIVRRSFFAKRFKETPPIRDVAVIWHTGNSGSGKSYTYVKLCEQYGADNVFLATDFSCNGTALFSDYQGEQAVIIDDYKGRLPYELILQLLQGYRSQIHCRYSNVYALYNEMHITSVFTPDEIFDLTVEKSQQQRDTLTQIIRRINTIVYHYKDNNSNYCTYELPMSDYKNYEDLQRKAQPELNGFSHIEKSESPFDGEPTPEQLKLPQSDTDNDKMPFED